MNLVRLYNVYARIKFNYHFHLCGSVFLRKMYAATFSPCAASSGGHVISANFPKEDDMTRTRSRRSLQLLSYAITAWLTFPAYTAHAEEGPPAERDAGINRRHLCDSKCRTGRSQSRVSAENHHHKGGH